MSELPTNQTINCANNTKTKAYVALGVQSHSMSRLIIDGMSESHSNHVNTHTMFPIARRRVDVSSY
jgi:hypothetical protein